LTAATNVRSRKLMERLGFARDAGGDFDHPSIPEGHELRRHVLYRIRPEAAAWAEDVAANLRNPNAIKEFPDTRSISNIRCNSAPVF
jgi:hypothetical protein